MKHRRAFTLVEVVISIAIFMLLAGGIFATVRAAFSASTEIVTDQLDAERMDAFQQFLRRVFISLPADAKVELNLRQQSGLGDVVEVLLWPIPAFLQFGTDTSDGAAISAQPDGQGGFRMMLGYFNSEDSTDERNQRLDREATWLTLLPGIKQIHWRFAPSRNPVFTDTWNEETGRPGLAELTLEMKNGDTNVYQFWIPTLQRRVSGQDATPAAPTAPGGGVPGNPNANGTPPGGEVP